MHAEPNPVVVLIPLLPYAICLIAGISAQRWRQCFAYAGIALAIIVLFKLTILLIALGSRAIDALPYFVGYHVPMVLLGLGFAAMGFGCRRLVERLTRQKALPPPPLPPSQGA